MHICNSVFFYYSLYISQNWIMADITRNNHTTVSNKSESIAEVIHTDVILKEETSINQVEDLSYKEDSTLNNTLIRYRYTCIILYNVYLLIYCRKLDKRLLPLLCILYLLSYIDRWVHGIAKPYKYFTFTNISIYRSNIGNAKLGGLEEDLNLSASEYQWCLSIFYFSYVLFDLPSNIIMRRWRPSYWLGILMLYVYFDHLMKNTG